MNKYLVQLIIDDTELMVSRLKTLGCEENGIIILNLYKQLEYLKLCLSKAN